MEHIFGKVAAVTTHVLCGAKNLTIVVVSLLLTGWVEKMYRLIYRSKSVKPIDWDIISDIMHSSEVNNQKHQITGALLATTTHFLQVIEGKYEDVNATFMRIARDDRHADLQLVAFHEIDARIFDGWGMKGIGVFDFNQATAKLLMEKYGSDNGEVKFPLEGWMALAMIHDIKLDRALPEWKRN